MANSKIVINVGINPIQAVGDIQNQLKTDVAPKLHLDIPCHIDTSNLQNLQTELNNISKGLSISVGAIDISQAEQSINKLTDNATKKVRKASKQITDSLAQITNGFNRTFSVTGQSKQEYASDAFNKVRENLAPLGKDVDVRGIYNARNELVQMLATVRAVNGEIRTFNYALDEDSVKSTKVGKGLETISAEFKYIGSTFNDAGVGRQINQINKFVDSYTQKLASLKSKVGADFAPHISATVGDEVNKTTVTLDGFEKKLAELRQGKGNITDLRVEFVALESEVKRLTPLLDGKDTLNPFRNAINNARNFHNEIKSLEVEYGKLGDKTKNSLGNPLDSVKQQLDELNKIQASEGYTEKWMLKYRELQVAVKAVTENIKVAKKIEKEDYTKEQARGLREIVEAYRKIQQYTKITMSPTATSAERISAQQLLEQQKQVVLQTELSLKNEGLLTNEITQQIGKYEQLVKETQTLASARLRGYTQQKEEVALIQQEVTAARQLKTINSRVRGLTTQANNSTFNQNINSAVVQKQVNQITVLQMKYKSLLSDLEKARTPQQFNAITEQLKKLDTEFVKVSTQNKELQASLKTLNGITSFDNKIKSITADLNAYALVNKRVVSSNKEMSSGMTFAQKWQQLTTQIADGSIKSEAQLKHFTEEMKIFKSEANAAGLTATSAWGKFLDSFKQVSTYLSAHMVFSYVTRAIRAMVEEVKSLDSAMTELRKVTVATDEDFEKFKTNAAQSAKKYGASISDIVNSTSTFARLGYNLDDANQLGKIATIYKNVGDGITEEQASEDLISTMKAFNVEASNAISIVDKFNEVGNNFAISSGGIGEALKRSASALSAANNDLSESIAIITTANTIVQDPDAVGTGVKTMSLRLRSTKTELEEMGEDAEGAADSVSKLRQSMLDLTGVDIQLDENTYKSSYQILLEMSKVWDKLDDLTQANVLEQLFGKRQANIGAAILENGRLLEQVYETSEQSAGSATREQEKFAKSVQFSFNQVSAAFQELSDKVLGSDLLVGMGKSATGFLTVLTKIVDTFGALPPILITISGIMAAKGKGIFATNLLTGTLTGLNKFKAGLQDISNFSRNVKNTWSKFDINLSGLSNDDMKSLEQYINILNKPDYSNKFGDLTDTMAGASNQAKAMATNFQNLKFALDSGKISQQQYDYATQNLAQSQRAATVSSRALSVALNLIANVGIMAAITLITKAVSKLVDKLVITREELSEIADSSLQDLDTLAENSKDLKELGEDISDLVQQYKDLVTSSDDVAVNSAELLKIQDSLNEKFADQKANLDLLNDSYETTIKRVKELAEAEYQEWKETNFDKIKRAEKIGAYNVSYDVEEMSNKTWTKIDTGVDKDSFIGLGANYGDIKKLDTLAASLYSVELESKEIKKVLEQIDGINLDDKLGKKIDVYFSGDIYNVRDQLQQIQDIIDEGNYKIDDDTLAKITSHYNLISKEIKDMEMYNEITQSHEENFLKTIGDTSNQTSEAIRKTGKTIGEVRTEWYNGLDDIEKKQLSNVDRMKEALQSLANGDKISFDDFWQIDAIDTGHILSDIQSINGEMTVSMESLLQLKDTYINKLIDTYEQSNAQIEEEHKTELENLKQYQSELEQVQKEIADNNIDINETVFGNINMNNRQTLEWTEQNLDKYSEAIKSWGLDVEELAGSISTVLGTSNEFDGVEIAFSPMLQTAHGAVLLNESTVNKYIWELIKKAGEGWTTEDLLKLDTQGIEVDGIKIKNIIADVGETAIKTGQAMHYIGTDGALETAKRKFDKVNESAKAYTEIMRNNNLMVEYLNTLLGVTIDKQKAIEEQEKKLNKQREQAEKELEALNKELDARLKAQQYVIDGFIDKLQGELDILENEKKVMEDELDVLNKQKEALEQKLSDYEKMNSLVVKTLNNEKKALEEERDTVKKLYDEKIQAIKDSGAGGEQLKEAYDDLIAIYNEVTEKGIDITKTVFGNIDTDARQLLEWTDENLAKYAEALDSWDEKAEDMAGTISTIMGASHEFDGIEIAFSPILQTSDGAVLLSQDTVDKYIYGLIDKAGEGWTNEQLFSLDTEGLEVDGVKIQKLLADIGETAIQTGEAMHYVGENGALAIAEKTIEALKTENEERQSALEYAQKLANLENARNRRVRVYDETKGWVYGTVREDIEKAQKELDDFNVNKEAKKAEKERDAILKSYDTRLKKKEDYIKSWSEWLDEVKDEEAETLMIEKYGADWRERIAEGDEKLLKDFTTAYKTHNSELQRLTKTEIKYKEESIKTKQAEIDAKKEQIKTWQDYKTEIQKAYDNAKSKTDDYLKYIKDVLLPDEKANLDTRQGNIEAFVGNVNGLIDQMGTKKAIIDNLQESINALQGGNYDFNLNVNGLNDLINAANEAQRLADQENRIALANALEGYNIANIADATLALKTNKTVDDVVRRTQENLDRIKEMFGFATGGVADYTGIAMLHGTKQRSETIFNANDSKKLYDMVHNTPNLMADMVRQATKLAPLQSLSNSTNNTSSVNIGAVNVYANNPQELAQNLDKTLESYFRNKLTQSYTGRY